MLDGCPMRCLLGTMTVVAMDVPCATATTPDTWSVAQDAEPRHPVVLAMGRVVSRADEHDAAAVIHNARCTHGDEAPMDCDIASTSARWVADAEQDIIDLSRENLGRQVCLQLRRTTGTAADTNAVCCTLLTRGS